MSLLYFTRLEGLSDSGGGEADVLRLREAERAEGQIVLRFLNILRLSFEMEWKVRWHIAGSENQTSQR